MRFLLFAALFLTSSLAVAELKIAIIDMQKAVQATSAGKLAKTSLEEEFTKRKKDLEKKEGELRKMNDDFEKKRAVMSEKAMQQKQAEFQEEMLKFREVAGRSEADFQKRQRELTGPILEKMKKTIDQVTKDKGYNLVIEKAAGVINYSAELDITELVVKEFEKTK